MNRIAYLVTGVALGTVVSTSVSVLSARMSSAQDPVKLSPQYYRVLLDNDQVRVLEYRSKPGDKEPTHSHPAGVVYYFNDASAKTTMADGKVTVTNGKAGDTIWRDPVVHSFENVGNTEVHALAVELKKACK